MTKPAATVLAHDTLESAAQRMWDGDCGVEESMSNQVFSVKPSENIEAAEALMAENRVRRIPVIDADNRPVGILSMNHIARESARTGSKLQEGSRGSSRRSRQSASRARVGKGPHSPRGSGGSGGSEHHLPPLQRDCSSS